MKKVMIYAYTYFNLGDDLFIKILCERYPNTQFVLYAPKGYQNTFKSLKNIQYFPSDTIINRGTNFIFNLFKIPFLTRRRLAKRCDLVVQIGGSLFIQSDQWQNELKNTKHLKSQGKPFFLLGANFGPYSEVNFFREHKQIFKQYTDICFRDYYSYQLFSDLNNVRIADDIAFTLKKKEVQNKKNRITISVIKPSNRADLSNYDESYYFKISEIVIMFIDQGYSVMLMSFCEYEKDHQAIKSITQLIPERYHSKIDSYYYKTNLDEALKVIAQSRFIVATRFHSMILAWVYGIPVFPIIYSEKMTHVINDIGFIGPSITIKDIHTLEANHVYKSLSMGHFDISKQIKQAQKHFLHLDALLTNEG